MGYNPTTDTNGRADGANVDVSGARWGVFACAFSCVCSRLFKLASVAACIGMLVWVVERSWAKNRD